MIVFEARPPVGRPQQRLNSTGQINKQVTHEKKPAKHKRKLQLLSSALESCFIWWKHWHGENRRHGVQRSNEDSDLTDPSSQQQSPGRLSISFAVAKHLKHTYTQGAMTTRETRLNSEEELDAGANLQERYNAIPRDGLQQPRGAGQTLKPCSTAGKEGSNHNHPRRRPRQRSDDKVPLYRVAKPERFKYNFFYPQLDPRTIAEMLSLFD